MQFELAAQAMGLLAQLQQGAQGAGVHAGDPGEVQPQGPAESISHQHPPRPHQRLGRDLEHTRWLQAQVDAAPDWERLAPAPLQTLCLRHRKPGLDEPALATHNLAIAQRINDSGKAYLTPSVLKGTQLLRVSIGAETTERRHVEALWGLLTQAAAE